MPPFDRGALLSIKKWYVSFSFQLIGKGTASKERDGTTFTVDWEILRQVSGTFELDHVADFAPRRSALAAGERREERFISWDASVGLSSVSYLVDDLVTHRASSPVLAHVERGSRRFQGAGTAQIQRFKELRCDLRDMVFDMAITDLKIWNAQKATSKQLTMTGKYKSWTRDKVDRDIEYPAKKTGIFGMLPEITESLLQQCFGRKLTQDDGKIELSVSEPARPPDFPAVDGPSWGTAGSYGQLFALWRDAGGTPLALSLDITMSPTPLSPALTITAADDHFAPSVELLTVTYDIAGLDRRRVQLTVTSDSYPTVVFQRELSASEKADGKRKKLTWDGSVSDGPLAGRFVNPRFSPYKVVLSADDLRSVRSVAVLVHSVTLEIAGDDDGKLVMNDPETSFEITSLVQVKKIDNAGAVTACEIQVLFTYRDPGDNNATPGGSYHPASGRPLGKRSDPAAVLWGPAPSHPATSDDAFNKSAKVDVLTAGADQGKAKVLFKPSGVGGDNFILKAAVHSAAGAELGSNQDAAQVWRSVVFNRIYEMQGLTHVSDNATADKIAPVFAPAYVRYQVGPRTELSAIYSVKYIGLWGGADEPQRDWKEMQKKLPAETPTAQELGDANDDTSVENRTAARTAISGKANAWAGRIETSYRYAMRQWLSNAGIPGHALVAIHYYHPKFSVGGGDDGVTAEWNLYGGGTPDWLRVATAAAGLALVDPDAIWACLVGVTDGQERTTISLDAAQGTQGTRFTICHEVGHATKFAFQRDDFGPLDHSVSADGIMHASEQRAAAFSATEEEILRGLVP